MRIIVVSYFFPPTRNVAAERWSRFVRVIERSGHEVKVLTGPWAAQDTPMVRFISDPISEDARTLSEDSGRQPAAKSRTGRLREILRSFLPTFLLVDGKWCWSLKAGVSLIRKHSAERAELVIVTGTPWSSVVTIGVVCCLFRIPFVTDFRDYWSNEPFLRCRSFVARSYFARLERFVLRSARLIMTVNEVMKNHFEAIAPSVPVEVFPNGFDGDIEADREHFNSVLSKARILYAGSIANYHGVPRLLNAISPEMARHFTFLGDDHVNALSGFPVEKKPSLPADQAFSLMKSSLVLAMTLEKGAGHYVTGKLMTYLKAGRPILYFGPLSSPAAELIRKHRLGWTVDLESGAEIKAVVSDILRRAETGISFDFDPDFEGLKHYSINSIGARLIASLERFYGAKDKISGS